jgi:hypothetical protein
VSLVPELTHYNPVFYDFLTRVAWDPREIELKSHLDDMVLRRYGRKSSRALRSAVDDIVAALFTRELNIPVHNLATLKWVWKNHAPWIQDYIIPRLNKGIRRLLAERKNQTSNILYENDLITFTKAYLAELAGYHFHNTHAAYSAGSKSDFDAASSKAVACIEWIARILSTRKDYTLADTIEHAMKVPGTNPRTPEMILQGVINWDYCSNDSYEQVANYDVPRLKSYFKTLRKMLISGSPPVEMWELVDNLRPNHDDWVKGKRTLQRTLTFKGKPADAVAEAFDTSSADIPNRILNGTPLRKGRTVAWKTAISKANWKVGKKGARIKRGSISSDPKCGPMGSYMYKEWVDMPYWGTVVTTKASGISKVDLRETPKLTIRYRVRNGVDYFPLWVNWKGKYQKVHRTRVWRTFSLDHRWHTDTLDLLHSLRAHGDEPKRIISLELGTANPPHEIEIETVEISS